MKIYIVQILSDLNNQYGGLDDTKIKVFTNEKFAVDWLKECYDKELVTCVNNGAELEQLEGFEFNEEERSFEIKNYGTYITGRVIEDTMYITGDEEEECEEDNHDDYTVEEENAYMEFTDGNIEKFIPIPEVLVKGIVSVDKYSCISNVEEIDACGAYFNDVFFFEDFKLAKKVANIPGVYTYTVVNGDDGKDYITEGWRFVNRIGYYFTREKIEMKDDIRW